MINLAILVTRAYLPIPCQIAWVSTYVTVNGVAGERDMDSNLGVSA